MARTVRKVSMYTLMALLLSGHRAHGDPLRRPPTIGDERAGADAGASQPQFARAQPRRGRCPCFCRNSSALCRARRSPLPTRPRKAESGVSSLRAGPADVGAALLCFINVDGQALRDRRKAL